MKYNSKLIIEYIIEIAIALVAGYIISEFVIVSAFIPTGSMIPTIEKESTVIGNKLSYVFVEPSRGDIIIFNDPNSEEKHLIKRVIGLPGETVKCENNTIYINDVALSEDEYISEEVITDDFGPYTIPENCYFMLGDNRTDSFDSRYWDTKFVNRDEIIAKALFISKPKIKKLK